MMQIQCQKVKNFVVFILLCLMIWYFLIRPENAPNKNTENGIIFINNYLVSTNGTSVPKIANVYNYINNTRKCLDSAFQSISVQKFDVLWLNMFEKTWLTLDINIEVCAGKLFKLLEVKEYHNLDEIKLFILPNNLDSNCTVVTLGIGKDVSAEEQLQRELKQCEFFGVDPDAEVSGQLYQKKLNGIFVQGLIGAKNGSYEASVLDSNNKYETKTLPHFSFDFFVSNYFKKDIIDYLIVDIEGAEFGLMEELIYNHQKYPVICQINVEFHNPYKSESSKKFFESFYSTIKNGPYLPLKTTGLPELYFNRMFLIGLNDYCINKYLSKSIKMENLFKI